MRTLRCLVAVAVLGGLLIAGCAQSTPVPSPTTAAAAPQAAAPTKVSAEAALTAAPAAPTAVPAKKVAWPEKGRTLTVINPYAPGGAPDLIIALLRPTLEKELGVQVQMVYKEGGGTQVGMTELAMSKPDGYTVANASIPTANTLYLDKERNAAFGRKDLLPLVAHSADQQLVVVKASSPFKTLQDYINAAKASPGKLKIAATGHMGVTHMGILQLEQAAGIENSIVHFNGQGPSMAALLGGHVDVSVVYPYSVVSYVKTGDVRLLATLGGQPSKFLADVPTTDSLGYKGIEASNMRGFVLPAGIPEEIVDILAGAFLKAMADPEHMEKMDEQFYNVVALGPAEWTKLWDGWDTRVVPLMELARLRAK